MPYKDPERQKQAQREWVAARRRDFFAGKSCESCGATADLELHHRDPNAKVAHRIWSWSPARRDAETAKCRVLCGGCHGRFHSEARRVEAELRSPCGTTAAYHRGCRCSLCLLARREYERDRAHSKRVVPAANRTPAEFTLFAGKQLGDSALSKPKSHNLRSRCPGFPCGLEPNAREEA